MKGRPERSVNEPEEAFPPAQVSFAFFIRSIISLGHSTAVGFTCIKAAHCDTHLNQPVGNFVV